MNRDNVKQVLEILRINYPSAYKDMSNEEKTALIALWHDVFGEYDSEVVGLALKNYIRTNKYPPNIGGLQEQIDLLTVKDDVDEKWKKLMRAIRTSGRDARAEFDKLPEECRAFVGSPSELRVLGNTDLETVNTVTRGQFYKRYAEMQKRVTAQKRIPESLKESLKGVLCLKGE